MGIFKGLQEGQCGKNRRERREIKLERQGPDHTDTCRPQGGFDLFSLTHSLTRHPSKTYKELGAGVTQELGSVLSLLEL